MGPIFQKKNFKKPIKMGPKTPLFTHYYRFLPIIMGLKIDKNRKVLLKIRNQISKRPSALFKILILI